MYYQGICFTVYLKFLKTRSILVAKRWQINYADHLPNIQDSKTFLKSVQILQSLGDLISRTNKLEIENNLNRF